MLMHVTKHQCKSVQTNMPTPFISPHARRGYLAVGSSASMEVGWDKVNQPPYRESAIASYLLLYQFVL